MGIHVTGLESSPLHLLHRVSQCVTAVFDAKMAEAGCEITQRQLTVLMAIGAHTGIDQTALAAMTGIDRSTMAELMRRLHTKKLVRRERSKRDARAYSIQLTDKGSELLRRARPHAEAAEKELTRALPTGDRKGFVEALERIVSTLDIRNGKGEKP